MIEIKSKEIKMLPLSQLKPYHKNRNTHPEKQIERLAKLYEGHGFRDPLIVCQDTMEVIAGCGRLLAAQKAGMNEVPVILQKFADEDARYAFMVSHNAIADWAELDLSGINTDIGDLGPDFDLELLGMEDFTLDIAEKIPEGLTDEDAVPEVKDTRCKPGDLWVLGNHRLLCGDSTNVQHVERLMGGEKADMVFTDPPYGVNYEGGHNKKKRSGIENDGLEGAELTSLFAESLANAFLYTHEHAAFYIWYANGKAVETFMSFSKLSLKVRAVLCWYKVRSGLGAFMSQYIPNYEPCIYAHKEGCSPQWHGPTDEKTVWELQKERVNEYHPTQKPVALGERAISNSTMSGQGVLDLFGGSGSTLIACEKTARKCFMMELDPHYCDVILSRWEQFTGKTATLEP